MVASEGVDHEIMQVPGSSLSTGSVDFTATASLERSSTYNKEIKVGIALGITSLMLMAFSVVAIKPILERTDPWWSTTVRLIGGMLFLLVQASLKTNRKSVKDAFTPSASWKYTIPAAVVGSFGSMIFWIMGMSYTLAITASILNQLSTVFIFVLGVIFLKEPLTSRKFSALLLGLAGAALIIFFPT